jgi:toxin FitB
LSYLVDTNVISELRKGERADAAVTAWFADVDDEDVFLSVLTIGEIRQGVERIRRRDPLAAVSLDGWLARIVELHRDRLIPIGRLVAEEWGRMNVSQPVPVIDGLLAATAKAAGMTLVTRNVADVERTGVDVIDPFAALD